MRTENPMEKHFPTRPEDICSAPNDDLIPDFLSDPNLLGKFRKIFEPPWNSSVKSLNNREIRSEDKLHIAGYWAQLLVCTPTWRRIGVTMYNFLIQKQVHAFSLSSAESLETTKMLREASEMLELGKIRIDTEPNFIRAQAAQSAIHYAWAIYNADWYILENDTGIEFVTSDNPAACEDQGGALTHLKGAHRKYLSVTPNLCIVTDLRRSWARHRKSIPDFSKRPEGTIRGGFVIPYTVRQVNRWITKCAEDLVICSAPTEGIRLLVEKYKEFLVENEFILENDEEGSLIVTRIRVRERAVGG